MIHLERRKLPSVVLVSLHGLRKRSATNRTMLGCFTPRSFTLYIHVHIHCLPSPSSPSPFLSLPLPSFYTLAVSEWQVVHCLQCSLECSWQPCRKSETNKNDKSYIHYNYCMHYVHVCAICNLRINNMTMHLINYLIYSQITNNY